MCARVLTSCEQNGIGCTGRISYTNATDSDPSSSYQLSIIACSPFDISSSSRQFTMSSIRYKTPFENPQPPKGQFSIVKTVQEPPALHILQDTPKKQSIHPHPCLSRVTHPPPQKSERKTLPTPFSFFQRP